jgi:hypothetical protein
MLDLNCIYTQKIKKKDFCRNENNVLCFCCFFNF